MKRNIIRFCKKLYKRSYVVANDGNISVRNNDGIYITCAGSYFSEIKKSQLIKLDREGDMIVSEKSIHKPSSELAMHLEVYKQRKDINAVIHAHSPYSTAFSLSDKGSIDCQLTEIKYTLSEIPIAPFARPGTEEVSESIRKYVKKHDAIILANHGILTLGKSLEEAFWNLERVEHCAQICYIAKTLAQFSHEVG